MAFAAAIAVGLPTAEARSRSEPSSAQASKPRAGASAKAAAFKAAPAKFMMVEPSAAPRMGRNLLLTRTKFHASSGRLIGMAANAPRSKFNKSSKARYAGAGGGISCVPFARAASGIELKGNATNWWDAAAGVYERGSRPEPGSVLNFRSTGRMRLGHVAVVTEVVDSRQVEIDHANWSGAGKGNVSRGVSVIDVSENNDWSAVRVELGQSGDFGSVYPTYGFIYDRPDRGIMVANNLANRGAIRARNFEEVAEAPRTSRAMFIDAPNRAIR
jgi:surface antigen